MALFELLTTLFPPKARIHPCFDLTLPNQATVGVNKPYLSVEVVTVISFPVTEPSLEIPRSIWIESKPNPNILLSIDEKFWL